MGVLILGVPAVLLTELFTGQIAGLVGLFFGLFTGLRGSRQSLTNDIQTVEALSWSWGKARKGVAPGLIGGLIGGLIVGLIVGLSFVLLVVLLVV